MLEPLRVLLIEDSEDDAHFTLRALGLAFQVTHERVDSAESMKLALRYTQWDVVISDYNMPRFSGSDAFLILKSTGLTSPFILVSGAIGEEIAVEAMRIGVDDYILKGNLARLVPAVRRELKRAEVRKENQRDQNALRRSESRFKRLVNSNIIGVTLSDSEGVVLDANDAFLKMVGYSREDLNVEQLTWNKLSPPDDQFFQTVIREQASTFGALRPIEKSLLCKNGTRVSMLIGMAQLEEPDDQTISVQIDITERKRSDEELKLAAQMQEAVVELGQFALQGAGLKQVFERAVQLCADLIGTGMSGLLTVLSDGKTVELQASVGWAKNVIEMRYQAGQDSHIAWTLFTKEAVIFEDLSKETRFTSSRQMKDAEIASGVAVIIKGADRLFGILTMHSKELKKFGLKELSFLQTIANVVAMAMERSDVEAQLNTSDRMATVGQLAAGVAHEVNNPLSYVTANLDLITTELESADASKLSELRMPILKMLKQVQEGVERVRVVVKDLTTFSRASEDKFEPIELEKVIDSSIRMVFNQIRHRAKLVKNANTTPLVMANEGRMGQVILNLLINAGQSIAEGNPGKNEIRVTLGTDQNGNAILEITDTGIGIPADILSSIFDPFFTTKPIGLGTGLGLSICRNIILKMHGVLTVESEVGFGTTVRVILPPAAEQTRGASKKELPKLGNSNHESRRLKVLLLDDEQSLLEVIGRGLSKAHEVVTTTSPLEALAMITKEKNTFDVIVCDLMMEEMTGMDFYDELRHRIPGFESRIIFMSGGTFTERGRIFLETVPNLRLAKPFNMSEIRNLLQANFLMQAATAE